MKTRTTDHWRYRKQAGVNNHGEQDVGYPALAAAIVRQAVDDWREATRLEKGIVRYSTTNLGSPVAAKYEIRKFLYSTWYGTLCDIDPKRILKKLKEEDHERH